MAQRFSVKINEMEHTKCSFSDFKTSIAGISSDIESVKGCLGISAISVDRVQRNLKLVLSSCSQLENHMAQMTGKLEIIINLYSSTEASIIDQTNLKTQIFKNDDPGNGNPIYNYYQEVDPNAWDYIMNAVEQIILGNFTDESNLLGIIGSVLVGCIPYVGQACDIRDIIADIYHLFEDGPETSEWISLGIDVVALIPLADLLKYSDETAAVLKHADEALGGLIDYTRGTWKYADEVFTKLDDVIQEGAEWTSKNINKIMDYVNTNPQAKQAYKSAAKLYQFAQKEIGTSTGGEIVKDIFLETIHLKDHLVDGAADMVDSVIDLFSNDTAVPASTT